jgi:hypothetical protein
MIFAFLQLVLNDKLRISEANAEVPDDKASQYGIGVKYFAPAY